MRILNEPSVIEVYYEKPREYVFSATVDIMDTTGDKEEWDEIERYEISVYATNLNQAEEKAKRIVNELVETFNVCEIDGFARAQFGSLTYDRQEGVELLSVEKPAFKN